ncbi:NEW3 domain-containing protein [Fictibacillus aquaticus]|uniref:Alpha-galactosidase NEW3 domain-containing protein n=1 Tax=Fictibacillus aquaticus TaxID=2021314 RepID=A0A235F8X0_9BACL|nr:NEW3 domain-containing protein [Fictibacillus aquaticus]OYD57534.1 hypothetical protein CGZ90_12755 [Fictibacillus aquaticus]
MSRRYVSILASLVLLFTLFIPAGAQAQGQNSTQHDAELWNALKPLDTVISFMNTGAHPDDERSDLLAYLSRGKGVRTASLIANRGEGGQNEIGTELGNGLGIIRSRELIEASKVTGVKVFHLSQETDDKIYDFGFSKSKEETLSKWGEEVAYERLIRLIRTYQPDIVMPSFLDVDTEHGHHRTINALTLKAFEDAADPAVFPEQLKEGLQTWEIKKLYLPGKQDNATTSFEIGMVDPVYGKTYPQLGEESRFLHKSQGMGRVLPVEPRTIHLKLENTRGTVPEKETTIFDGLPYDLREYSKTVKSAPAVSMLLSKLQQQFDSMIEEYPSRDAVSDDVYKSLDTLRITQKLVLHSRLNKEQKDDLLHRLSIKEDQLKTVAKVSSKLQEKVTVDNNVLVQGGKAKVTVTVENNGKQTFKSLKAALNLPKGWTASSSGKSVNVKPGQSATQEFTISVPNKAEYYKPYDESVIQADISYRVKNTQVNHTAEPAETVAVLPEVAVKADPENLVVNTKDVRSEIPVSVQLKNNTAGAVQATAGLDLPAGWTAVQNDLPVSFQKQNEEKTVTFTVKPPAQTEEGSFELKPYAKVNDKKLSTSVQTISYDHIGTFYYLYDAKTKGVAFPLEFDRSKKIGYVESGFDSVSNELRAVGMNITSLSEEQLKSADLSEYDTIVVGIRAYLSRTDLLQNNARLLDFAKNGGHLVVQYHKPDDKWNAQTTAPYPLTIGSPSIKWRVTDENAKVTMLQPDHPLFNTPNKITEKDWDNWIQERGLYYPSSWAQEYETFVSMTDPGEQPFTGGILMADYGEGSYLYTNLVWYRQIQGQVPGGYRIFTNLIDYTKN